MPMMEKSRKKKAKKGNSKKKTRETNKQKVFDSIKGKEAMKKKPIEKCRRKKSTNESQTCTGCLIRDLQWRRVGGAQAEYETEILEYEGSFIYWHQKL